MNIFLFFKKIFDKRIKLIILLGILLLLLLSQLIQVFPPRRFSKKTKADETITLSFDPASANVNANTDFKIKLKITPQSPVTIQGYLINLQFDKSKIKIKDGGIQYLQGVCSTNLGGDDNSKINDINGDSGQATLKIYGEIQNSSGLILNSSTDLAEITFIAKTSDATKITVNMAKVIKINSDMTLTELPMSFPTFNLNGATNDSLNTTSFNLLLKFQGINKKPDDKYSKMTAKVTLKYANGQIIEKKDAYLTANENGLWQGKVTFENVDTSRKMRIFIKGPKHLQKRICSLTPEETYPGSYYCSDSFQIKDSEVTLDAKKIVLLVGDIDQDGIISAYDIAYVRNNLNKKDEKTLSAADFNLDGIVDSQDYSLLIAALSVKSDEE